MIARQAAGTLSRLARVRGAHRRTARRIAKTSAVLAAALALAGLPLLASRAAAVTPVFVALGDGLLFVGKDAHPAPALGDIDGDGDFDAFVGGAYYYLPMYFFENTGTSNSPFFGVPVGNPFGLSNCALARPDLVDIDGDGDLDVFIGEYPGNTIFFANTGTSSAPAFAAAVTNPFGLTANPVLPSPEFVDIDGDGDPDAFIGNNDGDVIFFRNTGTANAPAFAGPATNPFGLSTAAPDASPEFADIDGDGDLDAFVETQQCDMFFFENTGTASSPAFAAAVTKPFGLNFITGYPGYPGYLCTLELVDIDGDGDLDAVRGQGYHKTFLAENTGTATAPAFLSGGFSNSVGLSQVGGVGGYASPELVDIDGDGDLDAFVGEYLGNTIFFANTGTTITPAFAAAVTNPFGLSNVGDHATPDLVDIDGDGDLDAFVGTPNYGNMLFFANTGNASAPAFAGPETNPFGLSSAGNFSAPELVDIDGDGDIDAFVGNLDGDTIFFANTGTAGVPAFATPLSNPFGLSNVGYFAAPKLVDIDGDGDLDAFVGEQYGNTIFFENTGTVSVPAFAAPVSNPFGLSDVGAYSSPEFVDIDGDGDLDGLFGDYAGGTFVFRNDAIGLPTPTNTPTNTPTVPTPTNTATPAICPPTPSGGCVTSSGGQLRIVDNATDDRDRLKWVFKRGPALGQSDFGDPTTATTYALCVYDDGALKLQAEVPPSSTLWLPVSSKGYKYSDTAGSRDGIMKMRLLGGTSGKSKLRTIGKGVNLLLPAPVSPTQLLNAATEVQAQLLDSQGKCYETSFTPAQVQQNDGTMFKARF